MAELRRNSIELMKEIKGDEVVVERFWTPPFTPGSVTKEALSLMAKHEAQEEELQKSKKEMGSKELLEIRAEYMDFIANRLYDKQFTVEDLEERYHGPQSYFDFQEQVRYASVGFQDNSTRAFLKSKR